MTAYAGLWGAIILVVVARVRLLSHVRYGRLADVAVAPARRLAPHRPVSSLKQYVVSDTISVHEGGLRETAGRPVYLVEVYFAEDRRPRHAERIKSAHDAMGRISALLAEHHGCEKIVVYSGDTRLFSVDCKGNTSSG